MSGRHRHRSERFVTVDGVQLRVHFYKDCRGRCPFHAPTRHHMRDWPMHWRADRGLVERICEHGVGHPDPDSLWWLNHSGSSDDGTHGCDGCC